jgi:uncharacterized damage-inducible protein DinB
MSSMMSPELASYLQMIEDLRGQVRDLIAGLPAEALNWLPLEGTDEHATNSLAVLATHIAGAEHFWIAEVVGGMPPTRDRDAEFTTRAASTAELVGIRARIGQETRQVFSNLSESDLDGTREARGRTIPVRWCILHVIDHSALHLGHMQLTYQLWMGGQAGPSPRWFERVST